MVIKIIVGYVLEEVDMKGEGSTFTSVATILMLKDFFMLNRIFQNLVFFNKIRKNLSSELELCEVCQHALERRMSLTVI